MIIILISCTGKIFLLLFSPVLYGNNKLEIKSAGKFQNGGKNKEKTKKYTNMSRFPGHSGISMSVLFLGAPEISWFTKPGHPGG